MNRTEPIEQGQEMRRRIKEEIINYFSVHGYAPSFREIRESVGLKSTASIQHHINRMLDDGELETDARPGTPRAIRVPGYIFRKERD